MLRLLWHVYNKQCSVYQRRQHKLILGELGTGYLQKKFGLGLEIPRGIGQVNVLGRVRSD